MGVVARRSFPCQRFQTSFLCPFSYVPPLGEGEDNSGRSNFAGFWGPVARQPSARQPLFETSEKSDKNSLTFGASPHVTLKVTPKVTFGGEEATFESLWGFRASFFPSSCPLPTVPGSGGSKGFRGNPNSWPRSESQVHQLEPDMPTSSASIRCWLSSNFTWPMTCSKLRRSSEKSCSIRCT